MGKAKEQKSCLFPKRKSTKCLFAFCSVPKRAKRGMTSIFSCNGWDEGALHLLYLDERTIQFSLNGLNVEGEGHDVRTRILVPAGKPGYVHVGIVFDGVDKTLTFYKNGSKTKQCKIAHTPQINFNKRHFIGSWDGRSRFFKGLLADVMIEEKLMTAEAVRQEAESYKLAEELPPPVDHTAELNMSKKMLLEKGVKHVAFVKRNTYTANHYYTEYINSAWLPGGNICVLDVETGQVREVVTGLERGVFERFDVSYDAKRIVFAWKKKPEQGYRLYEVNVDETGLRQLTFPQADEAELVKKYCTGYHHGTDDLQPCYLPDGGIAFVSTRCQFGILCDTPDNFTTTVLHRMDGDGKNIQQLSRSSVSETMPSIMPDGRILYTRWEFMDAETGKWRGNGHGLGPLFSEPYPLAMDCFLGSYKPTDEGSANQANGYGLYLLNDKGDTTLLYRDPEISCWRAIPLVPRKVPPVLASPRNKELAAQMARAKLPNGKEVWCPEDYDQQHICVSKDTALGLKVQHGIVPVEADGSANFLVPATGNVFFQVLDEHYMAVQTERTFVNYMPGESRACIGCHETPEDATRFRESEVANKGQPLAFKRSPSMPGPQPGEKQGGRPVHYEANVQPVLDKHCVSCHSGNQPKAGMSLSGERTRMFSVSYESLVPERRKEPYLDREVLGLVIGENHPKTGNVQYLPAYSLGSTTALLSGIIGCPTRAQDQKGLIAKHAEVAKKLTPEERLRVTNWIDTNCQYYGSYWYRRNKAVFATHPDYRRVPTYEDALRTKVQ